VSARYAAAPIRPTTIAATIVQRFSRCPTVLEIVGQGTSKKAPSASVTRIAATTGPQKR
jgi:hypothetical protein